jgi:molecular chaperone DnaK
MSRTTIDFGIDLGTTNSAIARLEETRAVVIKNNDNSDITPSAVYVDKNNVLSVGRIAKQRIEQEPDDAYAEFKLQMGTNNEYRFSRSGRTMKPEDLSAEVLKSLRGDVQQRLNEDLQAAVITVPAAFDLPQCDATKRAAQLAGLKVSPLIMEPTAAAMAHAFQAEVDKVFWLVYDFGGGTFDAAVIQIREGQFRIVNHSGDNHLGGKLIDWEIVEKLLAPAVMKDYPLSDFTRGNPNWRKAFAKLKWAAEEAKIRLSNNEVSTITIDYLCSDDQGEPVAFEYDLQRSEVARLAEPYIQRTINISRQALAEKRLGTADIQKVVLVGGPTLAPYVRQHLSDPNQGLGIALDFSIDPLTVVAQGAAIFAGTQRLDGEAMPVEEGQKEAYRVDLEYEPIGADPEPVVGGRVHAPGEGSLGDFTIEFVNPSAKPAWRSGKVGLAPNGAFMTTLWAERGKANKFQIELCDATGVVCPVRPDTLTYTVGVAPGAPPLIHSMGVALANNEVRWFFQKGASLPARQRKDLKTTVNIRQSQAGDLVKVPVIEGQNLRADRNKLIGTLEIRADNLRRDIPAGSDVEVTLEVNESRLVKASAYIPLVDQEFETELTLEGSTPDVEALKEDLVCEKKRLDAARQKAETTGDDTAQRVLLQKVDGENMVENIEDSLEAAGGDRDAADKAQNRLIDLKVAIDQVEDSLEWPSLVAEAENQLNNSRNVLNEVGDVEAKKRLAQMEADLHQAIEAHDVDRLRQVMEEISNMTVQILVSRPEFWVGFFQHLQEKRAYMRDRAQADALFAQGNQAIQNNDVARLQAAVRQLLALLPVEQQQEISAGYGSGVM